MDWVGGVRASSPLLAYLERKIRIREQGAVLPDLDATWLDVRALLRGTADRERVQRAGADDDHLPHRVPLEPGACHDGLQRIGERAAVEIHQVVGSQEAAGPSGKPLLELVEMQGQLPPRASAYGDVGQHMGIGDERVILLHRAVGADDYIDALAGEPAASPTIVVRPVGRPSSR